ncbi:MAG: InlB B-repeat-containing protein, partial [Lachnospiraceae bacterium]|nr:InlB B-repeat-containing protein [Lachnospiraceae bacterium]
MRFKRLVATVLCVTMIATNLMTNFALDDETIETFATNTTNNFKEYEEETESAEEINESIVFDDEVAKETKEMKSYEDESEIFDDESKENFNEEELEEETTFDFSDETSLDETSVETYEETTEKIIEESENNIEETSEEESIDETADDLSYDDVATQSDSDFYVEEEIIESETISDDIASFSEVNNLEIENYEIYSSIASMSEIASASDTSELIVPVYPMGNIHIDFSVPYINDKKPKNFLEKLLGAGNEEEIPTRWDSRAKTNGSVSIIPPVRNQNPYGTCWAFSTIGIMESDLRKKGIFTTDDDESRLSEAALAYFTYNLKDVTADGSGNLDKPGLEGNDYTTINDCVYRENGEEPESFADVGGNLSAATNLMTNHLGAVKVNGDTEYSKVSDIINNGLDGKYAFNSNSYEMENAYYINKNNKDLIKKAIIDHGAVGFSYFAISSRYDNINRQYYHTFNDANYTNTQWSFFSPVDKTVANHAIMIVGWDDNIPASNFYCEYDESHATNNGGWLCRNSWGGDWRYSDGGYFWLSYDETSLSDVFYAVDAVKSGKYEYNYHYDTTTFSSSIDVSVNNSIGHVYQVSSDNNQLLEAINIGLYSTESLFDIEIYTKDTAMNNCEDGTLKLRQEVSKLLAGYYTIELDKKIELKKGSYYSIVIKPKRTIEIHIDYSYNLDGPFGYLNDYNEVKSGQTYKGTKNGTRYDYYDYVNQAKTSGGKLWGISFRLRGFGNKARVITFDGNGGVGTMEDQYIRYASQSFINKNQFTKDDCIFIGWEDDDNNLYADGESITLFNDLNLRASWSEVSKVVAVEKPTKTVYNYGETVDLSGLKVRLIFTNGETTDIVYNNETKNDFTVMSNFYSDVNAVKDFSLIGVKYKSKFVEFETLDGVRENLSKLGYKITINNTPNFTEPISILKQGWAIPIAVNGAVDSWDMDETYAYNLVNNRTPIILYRTTGDDGIDINNIDLSSALMGYLYGMGENNSMLFHDTITDVVLPAGKIVGDITADGIRSDMPWSFYFRNNYVIITLSRQNEKIYFYPWFSGLLNSISIKNKPNKLNYLAGERFDPSGLIISANNVDRKNETESRDFTYDERYKDEFTFSPSLDDALTPDVDKITVSFRGFSCDLPIAVAENAGEMVTVTFDYDDNGKIATVSIPKGGKVMAPNEPTKKGYIFKQWERQNEEGVWEAFDFNTRILEDITLEALWSAKRYTVGFFENDDDIISLVSYSVPYNYRFNLPFTRASLSEIIINNAGSRFEGKVLTAWYCRQLDENVTYITPDDNLTSYRLNGRWRTAKYNLAFDLDGVAATAINPIEKEYNVDITLPIPTNIPSGYEFIGWYYNDVKYEGNSELIKDDKPDVSVDGTTITLKAHWKRAIVFNANGRGIAPNSIEITSATNITLPNITTKGYTFDGWYRSATDFSVANRVGGYNDSVSVDTPTTFYAKWTPKSYTINYNANGGSVSPESFTKTYDTAYTEELAEPTKRGYTFAGWFTDNNVFNKPYDKTKDDIYEEGKTTPYYIYAKWTAKNYTIHYYLNGGINTGSSEFEKTFGTPYTGEIANPTKTGYTFGGWYIDNNTFNIAYDRTKDDIYEEGTVAYGIYAKWNPKSYTINYNANGGTVSPTSFNKEYDNPYTENLAMPVKAGYTFGGWYRDNTTFNSEYNKNNDDIYLEGTTTYTIYAKWTENTYSITFDLDGGSWESFDPITMSSRRYSEAVTFPDASKVKKTGYTFAGWYNQAEPSQRILTGISANTVGNFVFVAKWNEKSYSITLNTRGGTWANNFVPDITRKYTESKTLPVAENMTYVGHRFVGWFEQSDEMASTRIYEVPAHTDSNMSYYAKWEKETYTITLNTNSGTINSGNVTSYTYGDTVTLPTDVTRAGYVFKGWWTSDGTTAGTWGTQVTTIGNTSTGNKTYYAKWANSYEVIFNLTTGVAPAESTITNKPATQNIESGGNAVRPTVVPTAPNYSFLEWYLDDTFTIPFNFGIAITRATTIYSKWENVTNHDVTFNLTSGAIHPNAASISNKPDNTYVVHNRKATKPSNPSATGYKFVNWYTDSSFTTVWDFNLNTVVADGTVIYGKWEYQTYNVTYNLNGGAWENGFTPTSSREYNSQLTLPDSSKVTKYAYTFDGWYEDSELNGTAISNITTTTAKNSVLYAKWRLDSNAKVITFAYDSSNNARTVEQAFFIGDDTALRTNIFSRSGYTFNGWKDLNGNSYTNTSELSDNIILIAQWKQNYVPYIPSSGG